MVVRKTSLRPHDEARSSTNRDAFATRHVYMVTALLKPQPALFAKWLWRRVSAAVVTQDGTVTVVPTRARVFQSYGTWETQSIERNVRWVRNGCKCRKVLESLCNFLSAVEAQTFTMSHVWWYSARRDLPAPIGSRVARSASPFGHLVPTWIALHFILVHCASLAERVFFVAVHCASGLLLCWFPLLHSSLPALSPALSICRRVWPTWRSTEWLHIAICGGCWLDHTLHNARCHVFPTLLWAHDQRLVVAHAAPNFFAASFSCGQVCVVKGVRTLAAQRWPPR